MSSTLKQKHSDTEWESKKSRILELHSSRQGSGGGELGKSGKRLKGRRFTDAEIAKIMEEECDFKATPRQYRVWFSKWGVRKTKDKKNDYKIIRRGMKKRRESNKITEAVTYMGEKLSNDEMKTRLDNFFKPLPKLGVSSPAEQFTSPLPDDIQTPSYIQFHSPAAHTPGPEVSILEVMGNTSVEILGTSGAFGAAAFGLPTSSDSVFPSSEHGFFGSIDLTTTPRERNEVRGLPAPGLTRGLDSRKLAQDLRGNVSGSGGLGLRHAKGKELPGENSLETRMGRLHMDDDLEERRGFTNFTGVQSDGREPSISDCDDSRDKYTTDDDTSSPESRSQAWSLSEAETAVNNGTSDSFYICSRKDTAAWRKARGPKAFSRYKANVCHILDFPTRTRFQKLPPIVWTYLGEQRKGPNGVATQGPTLEMLLYYETICPPLPSATDLALTIFERYLSENAPWKNHPVSEEGQRVEVSFWIETEGMNRFLDIIRGPERVYRGAEGNWTQIRNRLIKEKIVLENGDFQGSTIQVNKITGVQLIIQPKRHFRGFSDDPASAVFACGIPSDRTKAKDKFEEIDDALPIRLLENLFVVCQISFRHCDMISNQYPSNILPTVRQDGLFYSCCLKPSEWSPPPVAGPWCSGLDLDEPGRWVFTPFKVPSGSGSPDPRDVGDFVLTYRDVSHYVREHTLNVSDL